MEQNNFTKEQKEYLEGLFKEFASLDLQIDEEYSINEYLCAHLKRYLFCEDYGAYKPSHKLSVEVLYLVLVKWSYAIFYNQLDLCSTLTCAGCVGCEYLKVWNCDYVGELAQDNENCSVHCPVGEDICDWLCSVETFDPVIIKKFLGKMLEKLDAFTEENLNWLVDTAEMYAEDWKDSEEEEDYDR